MLRNHNVFGNAHCRNQAYSVTDPRTLATIIQAAISHLFTA